MDDDWGNGLARISKRALERRAETRRLVDSAGHLNVDAGPLNVQVIDLSEGGFSAEVSQPLAIGSIVTLTCPQIADARATVIWEKGREYGFAFEQPVAKHSVAEFRATAGVIWVDFKTATITHGPADPVFTRKFSGAARVAIALSLGMVAWGAVGGIGWAVFRLLR